MEGLQAEHIKTARAEFDRASAAIDAAQAEIREAERAGHCEAQLQAARTYRAEIAALLAASRELRTLQTEGMKINAA